MIDTIAVLFSKSPVVFGSRSFNKYNQNPPKSDYKNRVYKPRLTITRRVVHGGIATPLKIEFSGPKLLFLNNVDELENKDFGMVINTLQERLKEMGDYYRYL